MNGVWWTLPVEFLFYLILPVLALLLKKIGPWYFLLISLLITLFYRYWIFEIMGDGTAKISYLIGQLPGRLFVFSIGLSSAYFLFQKQINAVNYKHAFISLMALNIWSYLLLLNIENFWNGHILLYFWESITAILLMIFIINLYQTQNRFLTHGLFIWLGKISFGIYLWHMPVIKVLKNHIHGFLNLSLSVFFVTIILAWLSYHFIESKFSQIQ